MTVATLARRVGAVGLLCGWCAGLAAVTAFVAPGGPVEQVLETVPAEIRPAAWVVRAICLGTALHLALSTITSALGTAIPAVHRAGAAVGSPAFLRRLAAVALGVSLSAGPAAAGAEPPATTPTTIAVDATDGDVVTLRRAPTATEPVPPAATREWSVQPGDHFWSIAQRALARDLGRPPTTTEVHEYWHVLVETNRDRLLSADDPDLIHPGQTFALPPPAGITALAPDRSTQAD